MKPWTEIIVRSLGNDQDLFGGFAGSGSLLADMFIGMPCNWMNEQKLTVICLSSELFFLILEITFLFSQVRSPATVSPQN